MKYLTLLTIVLLLPACQYITPTNLELARQAAADALAQYRANYPPSGK